MFYLYHINTFTYYDLNSDLIIGRTAGTVVIPDQRLSGQHAKITFADNSYYLEDLASKNRTILNRTEIIPHEKNQLFKDSFLEMGSQSFIITDTKNLTVEDVNLVLEINQKKQVMKAEGVKLVREMKDKLEQEILKSSTLQNEILREIESKMNIIARQQALILGFYEERDKELQRLDKEKEIVVQKADSEVKNVNELILAQQASIAELKIKSAEIVEEHEKKLKRAKAYEKSPGIELTKTRIDIGKDR